jgi:hypothetical protein
MAALTQDFITNLLCAIIEPAFCLNYKFRNETEFVEELWYDKQQTVNLMTYAK